jgi:hypothetical protein
MGCLFHLKQNTKIFGEILIILNQLMLKIFNECNIVKNLKNPTLFFGWRQGGYMDLGWRETCVALVAL